ncbi:MAG: hypothetical protein HYV45_00795 [Candidatus Moranbacteria bacterium]|nr:hypothetical protein [Candidatus Moranbacteria bacterium]
MLERFFRGNVRKDATDDSPGGSGSPEKEGAIVLLSQQPASSQEWQNQKKNFIVRIREVGKNGFRVVIHDRRRGEDTRETKEMSLDALKALLLSEGCALVEAPVVAKVSPIAPLPTQKETVEESPKKENGEKNVLFDRFCAIDEEIRKKTEEVSALISAFQGKTLPENVTNTYEKIYARYSALVDESDAFTEAINAQDSHTVDKEAVKQQEKYLQGFSQCVNDFSSLREQLSTQEVPSSVPLPKKTTEGDDKIKREKKEERVLRDFEQKVMSLQEDFRRSIEEVSDMEGLVAIGTKESRRRIFLDKKDPQWNDVAKKLSRPGAVQAMAFLEGVNKELLDRWKRKKEELKQQSTPVKETKKRGNQEEPVVSVVPQGKDVVRTASVPKRSMRRRGGKGGQVPLEDASQEQNPGEKQNGAGKKKEGEINKESANEEEKTLAELTKARILSNEDFIRGGAQYVKDDSAIDGFRLDVTEEQKKAAQAEMEKELAEKEKRTKEQEEQMMGSRELFKEELVKGGAGVFYDENGQAFIDPTAEQREALQKEGSHHPSKVVKKEEELLEKKNGEGGGGDLSPEEREKGGEETLYEKIARLTEEVDTLREKYIKEDFEQTTTMKKLKSFFRLSENTAAPELSWRKLYQEKIRELQRAELQTVESDTEDIHRSKEDIQEGKGRLLEYYRLQEAINVIDARTKYRAESETFLGKGKDVLMALGRKYNALSFKKKMLLTGALTVGALASGGIASGALAGMFIGVKRVLSGAATAAGTEASWEKISEKRKASQAEKIKREIEERVAGGMNMEDLQKTLAEDVGTVDTKLQKEKRAKSFRRSASLLAGVTVGGGGLLADALMTDHVSEGVSSKEILPKEMSQNVIEKPVTSSTPSFSLEQTLDARDKMIGETRREIIDELERGNQGVAQEAPSSSSSVSSLEPLIRAHEEVTRSGMIRGEETLLEEKRNILPQTSDVAVETKTSFVEQTPRLQARADNWFQQIFQSEYVSPGQDAFFDRQKIGGTKLLDMMRDARLYREGSFSGYTTGLNAEQIKSFAEFSKNTETIIGHPAMKELLRAHPNATIDDFLRSVAPLVPRGKRLGLFTTAV